jgi:cytochrome P450
MTAPTDAADLVYDPSDPRTMADPFPVYARLREEDPVHWSPSLRSWIVTRHADVRDLLLSDDLSVNRLMGFYEALSPQDAGMLREIVHYLSLWIAFRDPPDHTRVRRIMRHAFTPEAVEEMRPGIEAIADHLLDRLEAHPPGAKIDLIREYALLVPAFVIMDMLGVPRDMLDDFKRWSDDMATFIGGARNAKDKYERAARGCAAMSDYFRQVIEARTTEPQVGFLDDLIAARDEGDRLSQDELVAACILVLFAGHETTTNLIGNAALHLMRNPAERAALLAEPELIDGAVEEVLRYDGPTNALVRVAARDHALRGKRVKEGERVFVVVNSANRDPRAFDDPDRFDIRRNPNRHLTFGQGIHLCLGARLAREEGRIAVRRLLERFPEMELDPDDAPEWLDAMVPRGTRRLPVRLREE